MANRNEQPGDIVQRRYEALVASQDDLVIRFTPDDEYPLTYVSESFCTLRGETAAALYGRSGLSLLTSDIQRKVAGDLLSRLTPDNPTTDNLFSLPVEDGSVHNIRWTATGIFDDEGRLIEIQAVGRDRTKLLNAERTIAESRTHYVQAAHIADVGFWVWDEIEDHLTFCTEEAAAIYGVSVDDALARSYSLTANTSTTHPDDYERYMQAMEKAVETGERYDITVRTIRADGELRFIRHIGEPGYDVDGKLIQTIGTVQDVTEQENAEEVLRSAYAEAERANRLKSEFLAAVSHEIRTPMNAICGFAELMTAEIYGPHTDQRYAEYAQSIRSSGEHLLSVINDILDLSKIEAGEMAIRPEIIDPQIEIEDCLDLAGLRSPTVMKWVRTELSDDVKQLYADPRIFRQIIINLLSNADKYTPDGGQIRVSTLRDDDGTVRVRVSDTGIGIAPESVELVMKPFGQAGGNFDIARKGTGLGLPLSRRLMELHGGRLSLDSEPGAGTTVILSFPSGSDHILAGT